MKMPSSPLASSMERLVNAMADDRGVVRKYVAVICNYSPGGNATGEKPF